MPINDLVVLINSETTLEHTAAMLRRIVESAENAHVRHDFAGARGTNTVIGTGDVSGNNVNFGNQTFHGSTSLGECGVTMEEICEMIELIDVARKQVHELRIQRQNRS